MQLKQLLLLSWLARMFVPHLKVEDRFKAKSHPCAENGAFFHRPSRPFKPHRNRKVYKKLRYQSPYA